MIPSAISTSLFVEGSHGEALKRTVVKSLVTIFSLLVPAACVLYLCGGWVLGVVGVDYAAGGVAVLRVMVVASLFVGVNYVYFAIKRVQKDVKGIVVLNGVIFVSLVGLGYLFMLMFGVVGALVCVGGAFGDADALANGVGFGCVGADVWWRGA